ncbi:MAG: hypothetical protein AAF903_07895 [Pseudomonadota bacterium]
MSDPVQPSDAEGPYDQNRRSEGKTFRGGQIRVDGRQFIKCTFTDCQMVYEGGLPPALVGCYFTNCQWAFGGSAIHTLGFLSGLYAGGFDDLVENTFRGVRKGQFLDIPFEEPAQKETPYPEPPANPTHPLMKRVPRLFKVPKN